MPANEAYAAIGPNETRYDTEKGILYYDGQRITSGATLTTLVVYDRFPVGSFYNGSFCDHDVPYPLKITCNGSILFDNNVRETETILFNSGCQIPVGTYIVTFGTGYLNFTSVCEEKSGGNYLTPLEDKLDDLITYITENPSSPEATEPQTVEWDAGDSLPLGIMKQLQETPNVSLLFSFTYEGVDHKVLIPAGGAFADEDITWYGPLWLLGKYGEYDPNKKEYTIESGDNLKALAKKFGMSLEELIAKNPQIKDPTKIYPGQVINY